MGVLSIFPSHKVFIFLTLYVKCCISDTPKHVQLCTIRSMLTRLHRPRQTPSAFSSIHALTCTHSSNTQPMAQFCLESTPFPRARALDSPFVPTLSHHHHPSLPFPSVTTYISTRRFSPPPRLSHRWTTERPLHAMQSGTPCKEEKFLGYKTCVHACISCRAAAARARGEAIENAPA